MKTYAYKLILAVLAIGLLCGPAGAQIVNPPGGSSGGASPGSMWLPYMPLGATSNADGMSQNNTTCWGLVYPVTVTVNHYVLGITTGGGGTDLYALCTYSATGALVGQMPPNAMASTGYQSFAVSAPFTISAGIPYAMCITTNAATPALRFMGRTTDVVQWFQSNTTAGGTTSGGSCASSITAPVQNISTNSTSVPWIGLN